MEKLISEAMKIAKRKLRELENILAEAEKNDLAIEELTSELLFYSVNSFATYLQKTEGFSKSTARDAIQKLEDSEIITKSKQGFYVLKRDSKRIDNIIKYQLYATPLPLENQSDSVHYIEVSDNMAPFLADLFNKSMQRNDKRFFSVAPNLLLLLDLEIPARFNIAKKQPFNLISFFKSYGITVRDYNTVCQEIKGKTHNEVLEEEFDFAAEIHDAEINSPYQGKLKSHHSVKSRTPISEN